jgi:hypothetical protein
MRRGLSVAVLLALLAGLPVPLTGAQFPRYAGRSLREVLGELGEAGLSLVFSDRIVLPEMRVRDEPRARDPRGVLEEILSPFGLQVTSGPGGRLVIVRGPAAGAAPAAQAASPPPPGGVRIGFRYRRNQRPLAASSVALAGERATAVIAPDGRIVVRGLPAGLHYLETEVPGFAAPETRAFSITTDSASDLVFDLDPLPGGPSSPVATLPPVRLRVTAGVHLDERADVSESVRTGGVGPPSVRVQAEGLAGTAGTVGNPLRAVQTLPGIGSAWGSDSRLVVRGGAPGENLVLVDGVESYSPYHLFGLSSAILPGALDSIEVWRGGFDARYGDRLSSAMLVGLREGRHSGSPGGSGGVGLLDSDLLVEGPLPRVRGGSWLVAGRYSFYDLVAGRVLTHLPRSVDASAKISTGLRAGQRLSLFGVLGHEQMNAHESDDPLEDFALRTQSGAVLAGVGLDSMLGGRAMLSTTVSFSGVRDGFDMHGVVISDARGSAIPSGVDEGRAVGVAYNRQLAVRDWVLRQELTISPSPRHVLEAGFEAHALNTSWTYRVSGERSEDIYTRMLPWPYGIPGANLPPELDSRLRYARGGAWVQYRVPAGPRLATLMGLRVDYSGLTRDVDVSPRASATAQLTGATRLDVAVGVYRQSPGYEKQLLSDYFVDLTHAARLHSARAVHAMAGLERGLAPGVTVRADAYRKWYANLLVGRLETAGERVERLAQYDFGPLQPEVPGALRITTEPSNDARGDGYGLELQIAKTPSGGDARLAARVSYTYSVANRAVYGQIIPFDYDRRHVFSLVANHQIRPWVALSASMRLGSGAPFTEPVGVRVAARADSDDSDLDGNRVELVPARDAAGNYVYALDFGNVSNINRARLPFYARLDGRVTLSPRGPAGRWSLYVDVINVLNRDNPALIRYHVEPSASGQRPRVTFWPDYSIPFLPSLGLRVRF